MKLFALLIMTLTLTGNAFAKSAKDAADKYDFGGIDTIEVRIASAVYSSEFEGEELHILQNLMHFIDQVRDQKPHTEHDVPKPFDKTAPHFVGIGVQDNFRELYNHYYILEIQLHSLDLIVAGSNEVMAAATGHLATDLHIAIQHVEKLRPLKLAALQDMHARIIKLQGDVYDNKGEGAEHGTTPINM